MYGISYRPTDLSLLKEFSKNISFEDFHNLFEQDCPEAVVHVLSYLHSAVPLAWIADAKAQLMHQQLPKCNYGDQVRIHKHFQILLQV